MLKKLFLVSLSALAFSADALLAHPSDRDRDRGGPINLECKFGRVERAGVAIVKDYGSATAHPNLRFAVLVGADAGRSHTLKNGKKISFVNFFGGGCEKSDQHSTVTAVEELYEETAKAIDLPSGALRQGRDPNYFGYVYSGDFAPKNTQGKNYTQLFFYRKNDASVGVIEQHMAAAAKNPALSHRFKETNHAFAIPLQDILDRARLLHGLEAAGQHAQVQLEDHYVFRTRGQGNGQGRTEVYLDPQYMRNIARDITRDAQNLGRICDQISGGSVR